jgi:urease accessory protein
VQITALTPTDGPVPDGRATGRTTGLARLLATPAGGRTRLIRAHSEGQLRVLRTHWIDQALPDLATVLLANPGGGILQGDRLVLEVQTVAGARLSIQTTSAARVYAMRAGAAGLRVAFEVAENAYLEYLPDPLIPYAGARVVAEATHVVHEDGVLVVGEVVAPGRAARGERLRYESVESILEVRRPGGRLLVRDRLELRPAEGRLHFGLMGSYEALGTLFVIKKGFDWRGLEAELDTGCDAHAGWSELPSGAGAWFKVLARDSGSASTAVRAAWSAARRRLLGAGPPPARRY